MNYEFKNLNTGEIEEHKMSYKDLDAFKEANPHLERYISQAPSLGDAMRMSVPGTKTADAAFEHGVIERIKNTVPGNRLKETHKTKLPREW